MTASTSEPDFGGRIGRTIADSEPWWPEPAGRGAPNVVMIVLDDTGFAHLGCYGSTLATPNIDRLAGAGLRYSNFHTTALCSPTRACLLTGRNHHTVGMRGVSNWNTGFPHQRGGITSRATTVAEALRARGYATWAAGKWHLAPMEECSAAARIAGRLQQRIPQWAPGAICQQPRWLSLRPSGPRPHGWPRTRRAHAAGGTRCSGRRPLAAPRCGRCRR